MPHGQWRAPGVEFKQNVAFGGVQPNAGIGGQFVLCDRGGPYGESNERNEQQNGFLHSTFVQAAS